MFVGFLWMACCKIVTRCWLFAWNDLSGGAQRDHHWRERHHWWSGRLGLVKCFFQDSESLCTLGLRYPSSTQDPRSVWLESDGWDLDFFLKFWTPRHFRISWWVMGRVQVKPLKSYTSHKKKMVASPQSSWILESCGVGCDYTKEVSRWFRSRWYSGYIFLLWPALCIIISHLEGGLQTTNPNFHSKNIPIFGASRSLERI